MGLGPSKAQSVNMKSAVKPVGRLLTDDLLQNCSFDVYGFDRTGLTDTSTLEELGPVRNGMVQAVLNDPTVG